MDQIDTGTIDPNDLPAGFTLSDPNAEASRSMNPSSNNSAAAAAAQQQQQIQQRQSILEQVMEPDALERLRRIKLVNSNKNIQSIENAIIQLATTNKIQEPITDGKLIEMLERQTRQNSIRMNNNNNSSNNDTTTINGATTISSKTSSGIAIQRKKYAYDDDDDDDDNDDDLL